MKLTFYIVRHGKTLLNTLNKIQGWCDSPLTDEGIEITEFLAKGLDNINFDIAYCSDLKRTLQTVNIILKTKEQAGISIIELPGLKECGFGSYESGYTFTMWTDIATHLQYSDIKALDKAFTNKEITYKDILNAAAKLDKSGTAENYETVGKRAYNALVDIAEKQSIDETDKNILIVSHGMTILVLMNVLGGENLIKGHLENASVCKVIYQNKKFTIESVGDMKYVELGKGQHLAKD